MTIRGLQCWKCGASLDAVLQPFSRLADCPACHAHLHVCRMCEYFDTTVNNSCREPVAEKVADKTRRNFCGYFQPGPQAFQHRGDKGADNRAALDALFGISAPSVPSGAASPEDDARRQLEDLFRPEPD